MKPAFLLAIVVWVPAMAVAQQQEKDPTPDAVAFEQASALAESNMNERALFEFEAFRMAYPKSHLVGRAHFNVAFLQRRLGYDSLAIISFKEILGKEEYNERDSNDIMEPYVLYKHHSCRNLAELYLGQKNYKEAERYIELFDKEYPYQHFCGNEWAAYHIYKDVMLAQVYDGLGNSMKAVRLLVKRLPDNVLTSNEEAVALLDQILTRNFTPEELKKEFQASIASLKVKRGKNESYSVQLFGEEAKFYIWHFSKDKKLVSTEDYRKVLMENELFGKYCGNK